MRSEAESVGISQRLWDAFTGDGDDGREGDPSMEYYLSQKGVAHAVIELHDRQCLSFGEIAQCFPFSREQIEQLYEQHQEDYPDVE